MTTDPTTRTRASDRPSVSIMALVALCACALAVLSATPAVAQELFCTTTTFETTGSCSTMQLDSPWMVNQNLYFIHSDAVARRSGDTVFVVNRYLADNILVLDAAAGYPVVTQYSTGLNSNPYDIEIVAPGRAYIPRYEETLLWVVDPLSGTLLDTVDLSGYADADGIPEMSQAAAVGDRVFVSIQRLDRLQPYLPPAGGSRLAVIDSSTDELVDVDPSNPGIDGILLPVENPTGDLWYERAIHRLLVVCSGEFLVEDGGLVCVNPFTFEVEGLVTSEAQLGGDLQAARLASAERGYAIISDANFQTSLVAFEVLTGERIQTVMTTPGFDLSDLEISDEGKLYLADRRPQNPGIWIFDASNGAPLGGPADTGLPPFDLVLRDGGPEGPITQAPTRAAVQLSAWPNPFNPRVELELRGAGGRPELEIVDARGRRIRRLRAEGERGGALRYSWDGTDARGRAVGSGNYWALPVGQGGSSARLSLIR